LKQHYCHEHQTKFFKNEKEFNGEMKVWYSHKKIDGTGFCVEKDQKSDSPISTIHSCNAMNNAIALVCNNVIAVDQVESYFKRILSTLNSTL
jgi:hypothetical protein